MAEGDQLEVHSYKNRPIHEALEPIIWLHGKWRAEDGKGVFPSIPSFKYAEELQFLSVGQPALNYTAFSWSPEKNMPLHLESGFLKIEPGTNKLAFLLAHNFGLTTVEEGEVSEGVITLECDKINRMSFSKTAVVKKTKRIFTQKSDGVLEQVMYMETETVPLTEHLRVTYKRVDSL